MHDSHTEASLPARAAAAFSRFAEKYGERSLAECLNRNRQRGIADSDYDCESEAETVRLLLEGTGPDSILETERLSLREMTRDDLPALRAILQDPVVMTAYEGAFSEAEVEQWLVKQQLRYAHDGFGLWAVLDKVTGKMIGQCGLTMQDANGRQVVEVGYLFRRDHWHRGYATEAARACKRYAFDVLDEDEVFSIIRDNNLASQAVARRNGMEPRGMFVKHYRGVEMPHIIFSAYRP